MRSYHHLLEGYGSCDSIKSRLFTILEVDMAGVAVTEAVAVVVAVILADSVAVAVASNVAVAGVVVIAKSLETISQQSCCFHEFMIF